MTGHTATPTGHADIGTPATPPRPTRRVTDAPTRVFHWLFALCFAGAYLTADGERLRLLHVTLGYTLAGLLAFRVLYGLFGPRQVRLQGVTVGTRDDFEQMCRAITQPWCGNWRAILTGCWRRSCAGSCRSAWCWAPITRWR